MMDTLANGSAREPQQNDAQTQTTKRPGVVIAHRVLSSLAICLGLLWVGIGVALMQTSPPSARAFSDGPGAQRQISYHSTERDKAPTYIAVGAIWAALFAGGLIFGASRFAYIYHTVLLVPLSLMFGVGLVLLIWWFRKRTRAYYKLHPR